MATEILLVWVITGAVLGAIVTPILYMSKRRNALPGVFVGAVVGAVGNLVLLVPLWISIARVDERASATNPAIREATLAPRYPAPAVTPPAQPASAPAEASCIIVEDDPDLYDTLMALFEIWNIDPTAFTSGTDAMKWIDDMERDLSLTSVPEFALLDIRLPGASGVEIARRLRESPLLGNIAIVLMTAYQLSPQEEREIMESGADDLIYKPLPTPQDLRARLRDVIARRQKESVR